MEQKYQLLIQKLPQDPNHWRVNDFSKFLEFIELQQLVDQFKENSIDGTSFFDLTHEDLENEIGINDQNSIIQILKWQKILKGEYQEYFKAQKEEVYESQELYLTNKTNIQKESHQQKDKLKSIIFSPDITLLIGQDSELAQFAFESKWNKKCLPYKPLEFDNNKKNYHYSQNPETLFLDHQQIMQLNSSKHLVLKLIDTDMSDLIQGNQYIGIEGATIGKPNTQTRDNSIKIDSDKISKIHSRILFKKEDAQFYIKDEGSLNGTFIKKSEIFQNSLIEIGETLLKIGKIQIQSDQTSFELILVEGNFHENTDILKFSLKLNECIYIGKESSCDIRIVSHPIIRNILLFNNDKLFINYQDDRMVSKRHIELSCNSLGKLHLLDLNSTNGTFKRISAEKEISDDHILNHLDIIKFGPFEFQIIKR